VVKRDVFGRLPTGYGKSLTAEFNLPTVNVAGVEFLKVPIMSKFLFFHPISRNELLQKNFLFGENVIFLNKFLKT